MKQNKILMLVAIVSLLAFSSCIKQIDKTFTGTTVAEIDATVLNSVVAGSTHPILTRIPEPGRPLVNASDSTIRRLNTTRPVRIRINMVGPHSAKDETVGYTVFNTNPVPTIAFAATLTAAQAPPSGQTPSAASATLTLVSAVANTHYSIAGSSGLVTIPANSSYGFIDVMLLNSGATAGQARFLGIEINNAGSIRANPNYSKIGIAIDQR